MAVLLYKWLLPLFFLLSGTSRNEASVKAVYHPFYVSVTEISHNAQERALEVSCKIFADDMEDVLKQQYKTKVDLSDQGQAARNNQMIHEYLSRHLAIRADGKAVRLSYLGYEKEKESVYCYFEVLQVPSVKKMEVTNSILQDFTDKQINILHVHVGGSRKSHKLDYPQKMASFTF